MSNSILPSGEELKVTPEEVLRYVNPDALRQMFRQERLRWNLKPNRDAEYFSNTTLFKYVGQLHNEVLYQRMEIRTFPDNGGYAGYAGLNNDSGEFGLVHNVDKLDYAISAESLKEVVNRSQIGALAKIPGKLGYGLNDQGEIVTDTDNRMAMFVFDPFDGRIYNFSNDDPYYVNNERRKAETRLPSRTSARIGDIPTRMTDMINDLDFVSDPDYGHTDNNFTNSNRYILDNLDDRTFVYPEIAKDRRGNYIENFRIGLSGEPSYGESDGVNSQNTQPDFEGDDTLGDRAGDAINSININHRFSGVDHKPGYMPGIFRSVEELERVDLIDQLRTPLKHTETPGGRRMTNWYQFDGIWSPTWFDRYLYNDSYLAQPLHPSDMETWIPGREPVPLTTIDHTGEHYTTNKLYQWRYNRVTLKYYMKDIAISIVSPGEQYKIDDILRWSFGDDVLLYKVTAVGPTGQIQAGQYVEIKTDRIFKQDPSTHDVGIPFTNMSGVGRNAKLAVYCRATIETNATQLKNNLYAYVDVVPSVRSDNSTPWSDVNMPDTQGGKINIRSTASNPGFTGVNSGRGGPKSTGSKTAFHEHGGNATAGVHVHLFRYVINTQNPTWVVRDGIQVFTGRWVDQGPMGVERPCDIKALLFSNFDTNNFNNYYKFQLDLLLDNQHRNPDAVLTNNSNALAVMYIHKAQRDPTENQRFHIEVVDPDTSNIVNIDITDRVQYVNEATGMIFLYNTTFKNDPNFGYGSRLPGWYAFAGAVTR